MDSTRSIRARTVLEGLSVGDAFGEMMAYGHSGVRGRVALGVPAGPWWWTDDTAMALGIEECLHRCGAIEEEMLAWIFARNFKHDPDRGYGKMAAIILRQIGAGELWESASRSAFSGGSMGNGAAMRVAPLGAWFADDLDRVVAEAMKSARVTHWHPEGIAGAIAVAVATACAWQTREIEHAEARKVITEAVLRLTPPGDTREGLVAAVSLEPRLSPDVAGRRLGNGSLVTAPDTVPFVIWSALRSLDDFQEAVIATVEAGGDCDTNAAMVGGIVAARLGASGVPPEWIASREALPPVDGVQVPGQALRD
ncbi:ADP-ribosylglycohydrolase family protein [Luteolibacter flavescens]|uniref:ADP-ribosylglycohydrolase family protein n=1 Tax=Luteolibacter flavescens TaxID=1859460 RepID=A0ABT3FSQ7_9BACT|nr:ADP-ribosylglycohydrolase family protein [Luteolibacter flavescens]MCW1886234.1 ADP-ribosylglycohydrolase family protein [Luteolibacter flavescens]